MTPEHGPRASEIPPGETPGAVEYGAEQEPLENDGPSDAANRAETTNAQEEERLSTSELAFAILLKDYFDADGNLTTDLEGLEVAVVKTMLGAEDANNLEVAKEVVGLLQEVIRMISDDLKAELKEHPETRTKIVVAICEPVIRGHLTPEDITSLVTSIDLYDSSDGVSNSKATADYEGFMHYDPSSRTIRVAKEALTGQVKLEDGTSVKLDMRHMILHEVSHGLDPVISPSELLDKAIERKAEAIDSAEIAELKRILESAREGAVDGYLTMHSINALSGLNNIENDYQAISDEQRQRISPEQYEAYRLKTAVREVLTDYTAIYLKSDGSMDYFVRKAIDRTSSENFDDFLIKAFNVDNKEVARDKFATINTKLDNGEMSDGGLQTGYPEIYQMTKTLGLFYGHIDKRVRAVRGRAEQLSEEVDGDDDFESYGGNPEAPSGFAQPEGSASKNEAIGWLAQSGELLRAFSDEVNLTDPITK